MGFKRITLMALWVLASDASGQLQRWLARGLDGVHIMDLSTPSPSVGPAISGLGSGGEEDVNLMTDAAGNLLFCTAVSAANEIQVWDAGLAMMPNGFGLFGHSSTLQSAICPIPCHPDRYFIIHLLTGPTGDLFYSTVDMNLNGGLGDVVLKNQLIGSGFTEGLAISHQLNNGCRWLFTSVRNGNTYDVVRCLISQTSIGPPTVIASVSPNGPIYNFNEIELSPDNSRLAMSVYTTGAADPDVMIWDLDLQPGTLSNPVPHSVSSDPIIGIQFSPAGNYLYFLGNGNTDAMDFGRLNVLSGAIDLIDPNMGRYLIMVELAGNGRIYAALNYNYTTMAEVAFPDAPTVAGIGYDHNAVFVTAAGCRPPLPNAIEGEPPGTTVAPGFIEFAAFPIGNCDTYQFVDSTCLATWREWDLGDGTVTNDLAPIHQFAPGTYDVTLRVLACGDTLTLVKPAYITSNPDPVVAGIGPIPGACPGQPIDFINASVGATAYQWQFGDGGTSNLQDPSHAYSASGQWLVTLVAYTPCSSDTTTAWVQITPGPVASFNWTLAPCQTTATFSNTSSAGSSWSWSFGDGATSSASSPAHDYSSPGTYLVSLVADPGSGCADTASTLVSILAPPIAAFAFTPLCGLQINLQQTGTGGAQWAWDFGDGLNGVGALIDHAYGAPGDYTITLTVTGADGCATTISNTVSVVADPIAAFTVSGGPCDSVRYFQNISTGASSYQWQFGDGSASQAESPAHGFAPGTYMVTLVADPSSACADTASFSITIDPAVAAVFTMQGDSCSWTWTFTSLSSDFPLLWQFGDGATGLGPSVTHAYSQPGSFEVMLIAAPGEACADTAVAQIELDPLPTAAFTAQADCELNVAVTDASINANVLLWFWGDGSNGGTAHAYAEPGIYPITLVAAGANGCVDTTTVLTRIPEPVLARFAAGIDPCSGLLTTNNRSLAAAAWLWDFGDGTTSTQSEPTHAYASGGHPLITLIAFGADGCADTLTLQVDALWAGILSDWYAPNVFTPNGDGINDRFSVEGVGECETPTLMIFNRWGELLLETTGTSGWDGNCQGQPAPDGTYVFLLEGRHATLHGHVSLLR